MAATFAHLCTYFRGNHNLQGKKRYQRHLKLNFQAIPVAKPHYINSVSPISLNPSKKEAKANSSCNMFFFLQAYCTTSKIECYLPNKPPNKTTHTFVAFFDVYNIV